MIRFPKSQTHDSSHARARRAAKRAAQVATLGLALTGCARTHFDTSVCDAEVDAETQMDAQTDASSAALDAHTPDAALEDASLSTACEHAATRTCSALLTHDDPTADAYLECCDCLVANEPNDLDAQSEAGCLAWGPYVAPSEHETPISRALAIRTAVNDALGMIA